MIRNAAELGVTVTPPFERMLLSAASVCEFQFRLVDDEVDRPAAFRSVGERLGHGRDGEVEISM